MPTYTQADWYDLPLYYDIVFDTDTTTEADFLHQVCERYVDGYTGRILEPACGSGRLMAALADRGFAVSGFDVSQPMLDFAATRLASNEQTWDLKQAQLDCFSYRKRYDMAHCLVSTFKYLTTDEAALSHLQCVADVLRPGGIYVLGLHLTDYAQNRRQRERWTGSRAGIRVTSNLQCWPPQRHQRREQVRSRLIVERNGETRRYETHWSFRTYDRHQFRRLLARTPRFEHVATYDFCHDIDQPVTLSGQGLDKVMILRRRD